MYIKDLYVYNFKGIDHCQLSFHKGFNLIIGENGKGKTSLLEAVAIGISGFVSGAHGEGIHPRNFLSDEARTVYILQGDGACEPVNYWPKVEITADINGQTYQWERSKSNYRAQTKTTPRDIYHLAEALTTNPEAVLPVICYQSAGRVWSQKRRKAERTFSRKKSSRVAGYIDCMSDEASVKLMLEWCSRMEQIAWQNGTPVREYEAVKQAVAKAMTQLENEPIRIFYDKRSEELMYQKEGVVVPISVLSAGYQSLIWMIFDIAYRMATLNPFLAENISQAPGLVLIDELDVHLHPRWQWQVIDVLRHVFPNVQFIATTHSPIIIASAKNVWCIDIEQMDQPKTSMSGYGLEIDYILKKIQNATDLPDSVEDLLKSFYQCIDKEDFSQAKVILSQLEQDIGRDSPLAVKARERLDLEIALMEE